MTSTDRRWSEATRELVRPLLALHFGSDHLQLDAATDVVLDALSAAGLLVDPQELERLRERLEASEAVGDRLRTELVEMTAERDGRQRLIEAQGRVQLGHEATIRELRARVAELQRDTAAGEADRG